MNEYLLRILNTVDHLAALSPEKNKEFLKACESYISNLQKEGKLLAAQPLVKEGMIISGTPGNWKEAPFAESKEVQVGYYHILAKDMDDAVAIAKGNPEFAYTSTARVEVRPLKMKEVTTDYVYPARGK